MKYAKSVMTENPKCIQSGELLVDTIGIFFKNNIHYAPVITPTDEVLGLLSDTALIKASLRHYLDADKHERVYAHRDLLEPVYFVDENAPIEEVMRTLMKSKSKRILVHDYQMRLVGIISPKDILKRLHGEHNLSQGMSYEMRAVEDRVAGSNLQIKDIHDLAHVYREAFESSPLLMHSVDANGTIVMANRKIHAVLGYHSQELIGKTMFDLYLPTVHEQALAGLENIKRNGSHRSTMTQMLTKDGKSVHIDVVSSALRSSNGTFLSTISVSRVIDDSKDLLFALQGLGE